MKKTFSGKVNKWITTVLFFVSLVVCLSFNTQAAMSSDEMKSRLSSYSDYIVSQGDSTLYLEHGKYDISEKDFLDCVSKIAKSLMGQPMEDYCKLQIKFYFSHNPYGSDFETFGENIFRLKKQLGNFWTEWSRYNKMTVTATSYSAGEKFSANVILFLNGCENDTKGAKYNKKLTEIIAEAEKSCSTDMEKAQYYLDWLNKNADYSYLTGFTNDPYYALIVGKTVCGGYANAFKDLCNASGIPATVPVNQSINHAWSQVYLNGIWYTADLCKVVKPKSGSYNGYLFTDPDTDYDCREYVESNRADYVKSFTKSSGGSITGCKFSYDSSHGYTGSVIKPSVKVTDGKKTLKAGKHYTVKYYSNVVPGTASIAVEGISKNGYTGKKVLYFKIALRKPEITADTSANSTVLKWNKVKGATGYIIRLYNSKTGSFDDMARVKGESCTVRNLVAGEKYIFAVRSYVDISGKQYLSAQNEIVITAKIPKVTSLKISSVSDKSLRLSWKKVRDAEKYEIYISTNGKSWKKKATVTDNTYTVKSLKSNKKYYFRVRAVQGTAKGSFSSKKSATTLLSSTKARATAGKKKLTVKWSKVTGASGYVVYYSTNKKMSSAKKVTVKGSKKTSATLKKLKGKKKYYIRVRAYKVVDGKRVYGKYSSVISKRTK